MALALAHRRLSLGAFDPVAARSLGAVPARVELALLVLLALTTVAAAPAGSGPCCSWRWCSRPAPPRSSSSRGFRPRSRSPPAWRSLAGTAGLLLSYHLAIAAGAAVALCAVALFGAAAVAGRALARR